MPTKRFQSLDPVRRDAILDAAASEFAACGFEAASYNRIIERAGTSKGSMYYYFEDKADLYATVVRGAVVRFLDACGPIDPVANAEGFWDQVRRLVGVSLEQYRVDPHLAGLVRSLASDGLQAVGLGELRALSAGMWRSLVEIGQEAGAVRSDLPFDLVMSVAVGVSEGLDVWLAGHADELDATKIDDLADTIVDLYRRMAVPIGLP